MRCILLQSLAPDFHRGDLQADVGFCRAGQKPQFTWIDWVSGEGRICRYEGGAGSGITVRPLALAFQRSTEVAMHAAAAAAQSHRRHRPPMPHAGGHMAETVGWDAFSPGRVVTSLPADMGGGKAGKVTDGAARRNRCTGQEAVLPIFRLRSLAGTLLPSRRRAAAR